MQIEKPSLNAAGPFKVQQWDHVLGWIDTDGRTFGSVQQAETHAMRLGGKLRIIKARCCG